MEAGVFIDIDGVVLQGGVAYTWSEEAIRLLLENQVPFVFVTNGTYSSQILLKTLQSNLNFPFTDDHIIVAPSPCTDLTDFHKKRVLACCQDDSLGLIKELGFTNHVTIAQLVELFPELDYVDHSRRIHIKNNPQTADQLKAREQFQPIEAILLLGEPVAWECALQVIIDVLMTNGDPKAKFKFVPWPHLPIIACNKDLTFKGAAALPRFGHGAFLECLESLYMKITKNELIYDHLMGKPYQITYEYAANKIQKQAKQKKITKFFMIGDNPDVDIRGANTYKEYLQANQSKTLNNEDNISVESILVCTGVYNPQNDLLYHLTHLFDEAISGPESRETEPAEQSDDNNMFLSVNSMKSKRNSRRSSTHDLEKNELKSALSRRNSFISYFDNRLNVPDVTVNNFLDAVHHILNHI